MDGKVFKTSWKDKYIRHYYYHRRLHSFTCTL